MGYQDLTTSEKIKKGLIKLQLSQPFFSHICMHMIPKEEKQIPSIGVDANWGLYYNPEWIEKELINIDTMIGVLCHEGLHLALNHIGRTGIKDRHLANIAQDMAINMICKKSGLTLVEGENYIIANPDNDTCHMSLKKLDMKLKKFEVKEVSKKAWERIYEELLKQLGSEYKDFKDKTSAKNIIIQIGKNGKEMTIELCEDGTPITMDTNDHNVKNKSEEQNNSEKAKQIFASAVMNAKMKGKLPGGLERYIQALLEPKIPWRTKLLKYVKQSIDPHDWTYRRPHRKSHSLGIFMPSVLKENIDMEVVIDVSGSVGHIEYQEFISELYGIMSTFKNITIYLTFIDCKVTDEFELRNTDKNKLLAIKPKGVGGTDMELAFEHIKNKNRGSKLLICFTDGYTDCGNNNNFPFNIIWVICSDGMNEKNARNHFKYGDIIKM